MANIFRGGGREKGRGNWVPHPLFISNRRDLSVGVIFKKGLLRGHISVKQALEFYEVIREPSPDHHGKRQKDKKINSPREVLTGVKKY